MRRLGVMVGRLLIMFSNETSFLSGAEIAKLAHVICNNHAGYFPNKAEGEVYMALNLSNAAGLIQECRIKPCERIKHMDIQLGDKIIREFPVIDILDAGNI